MSDPTVGGLPIPETTPEDTATAILAGLIETVRVMRQNAYTRGLTDIFADYDHALTHLESAADYLPPSTADAYTNPIDRIEAAATKEQGR